MTADRGLHAGTARSTPRRRRWLRTLLVVVGVIFVAGGSCTAWLLRDPTPWILHRRSSLVRVEPLASRRLDGDVREDVRLLAASGLTVDLAVRYPADSTSGRRPAYLILGGYVAGMDAIDAIPGTRGASVAVMQYPYPGRTDIKGLAVVPQVPAIRKAILDTPAAVMIALDYLRGRPDVDSTRTELVGASFGAPFAVVTAALDQRVTRVWVLHGAADPYALFYHGLRGDLRFPPLRAAAAWAASVLSAAPRLDPARWIARVSPRPVVMINAREDERIPNQAVMKLWDAAREPRSIHWLPGPHMRRSRQEVLAALVDTVLAIARADSVR
jgi:hypothetical protein